MNLNNNDHRYLLIGPYPPLRGGIAQHSERLVEGIEENGNRVDVLSWKKQYPKILYKNEQIKGSDTETVKFWLSYSNPLSWVRSVRHIRKYDRIVMQWATPFHAPIFWLMSFFFDIKRLTIHVHNASPHERMPFSNLLTRLVVNRCDKIVCHAESIKDDLLQMGVSPNIEVVSMPPLMRVFESAKTDPPTILVFGFIREYKGTDIAIGAMGKLKDRGYRFKGVIAGQIWNGDESKYIEMIEKNNISDITETVFGYISDTDSCEIISHASIILAPYRSATQSGVTPLASLSGNIPVVTNVGGLSEGIRDKVDGVICREVSEESVCEGLEYALDNLEILKSGSSLKVLSWNMIASSY